MSDDELVDALPAEPHDRRGDGRRRNLRGRLATALTSSESRTAGLLHDAPYTS